jgi:hypothetical protein
VSVSHMPDFTSTGTASATDAMSTRPGCRFSELLDPHDTFVYMCDVSQDKDGSEAQWCIAVSEEAYYKIDCHSGSLRWRHGLREVVSVSAHGRLVEVVYYGTMGCVRLQPMLHQFVYFTGM